jgi:hypothetical protein
MLNVLNPMPTTGKVGMWNGTKDGQDAYLDHASGHTNVKLPKLIDVTVEDLRSLCSPTTFINKGYQMVASPTAINTEQFLAANSDSGKEFIEQNYYPEVLRLIKEVTGSDNIIPFGFRLRQQNLSVQDIAAAKSKGSSLAVTHVDRDPLNARARLDHVVGTEEAERLLHRYKRWATVNIWRPVGTAVQRWPLLLVDHSKIPDWDYETHMARLYTINDPSDSETGGKGHDTVLKHDPRYEYYYASRLDVDEVLLFSSFDSDATKVVPHGAFWDNATADDAPARRSIEVRSFVFFDEVESN